MSDLNALAETLRQLFEARQYQVAERFIDHCNRHLLERLIVTEATPITLRIDYVVKKKLRRRDEVWSDTPLIDALPSILNLWCREGRRIAVRQVLAELDLVDLEALAAHPELDPEVISMSRAFRD